MSLIERTQKPVMPLVQALFCMNDHLTALHDLQPDLHESAEAVEKAAETLDQLDQLASDIKAMLAFVEFQRDHYARQVERGMMKFDLIPSEVCPHCHGNGGWTVKCSLCGDDPDVGCILCDGKGHYETACTVCHGFKRIPSDLLYSPVIHF